MDTVNQNEFHNYLLKQWSKF
ncbi:hypothetical protein CY0110_19097 [Crocosphaera chwakensis CCY0110]|uniref:Uncharacterized protein n=2 Tax=Crocosphaera TaxID=263510 RepID=A3IJF1_9CHRO|nr:hypothetical protein CY0110_19097 [Crocosphaera chwakensis CCY0110]